MKLPAGVRSRIVDGVNGLSMHVLEAGDPRAPCVLLLHGFPELAYSWRHVLPALASAGFHAVAPDQRGYGRTTGWDPRYDGDVASFAMPNLVADVVALLDRIGHRAASLVGHDFGSPVAAYSTLARPDLFRSLVLMSAPFGGPPAPPFPWAHIDAELGTLTPRRKHYQIYYSSRSANEDMWRAPQGLHAFLRAYYHVKSGDWEGNRPYRLPARNAEELEKLPTYYIMKEGRTMAETVRDFHPSPSQVAACRWLPEEDLRVYTAEFGRTGFQGGLQWYRCGTDDRFLAELHATFGGRAIEVPAMFIAGERDWGVHQKPWDFETMRERTCPRMREVHLIEGAGHWVQQERPDRVSALLLDFLGAFPP